MQQRTTIQIFKVLTSTHLVPSVGGSRSYNAYRIDESIRRHCLSRESNPEALGRGIGREFASRAAGRPRPLDGFRWLAWTQSRNLTDAIMGFDPLRHCAVGAHALPPSLGVGDDPRNDQVLSL